MAQSTKPDCHPVGTERQGGAQSGMGGGRRGVATSLNNAQLGQLGSWSWDSVQISHMSVSIIVESIC